MMIDFSIFPNVIFPINEPISSGAGIESRAVENFFRGRARFEISLKDLNESYKHDPSACLGFMLPSAFAFFLPLFMRISVLDFDEADVISDTVVYRLRDMGVGRAEENLNSVLLNYTKDQLNVILDFLSEMSRIEWQYHDPNLALEAYQLLSERF